MPNDVAKREFLLRYLDDAGLVPEIVDGIFSDQVPSCFLQMRYAFNTRKKSEIVLVGMCGRTCALLFFCAQGH